MTSQQVVSVLLLVIPCLVSASTTYEGYGTVYTLGTPSSGNCNFMSWPDAAVTKYAALNAEQWEETMNCGRCAEVSCTDASCSGQSEIVYIMDQCPGCAYGDLDLSPDVFESITGQSYTKLSIEWKFVDCPISNNVQYCLKTGSSGFWVAVQPTNCASGVKSLSINGQETSVIDSAYYFLIDGSGESVADLSSLSISMIGVNGEVLEETLSLTADECTEGSSQFSPSGDTSQTTITSTKTPPTSTPTTTSSPTYVVPSLAPITEASTSAPPTTAPVTKAPTTTPVTAAPPTGAPMTHLTTTPPTTAPLTEAPTAPVTDAPTTAPPTTAPVTEVPTTAPATTAPSTEAPTLTPSTPTTTTPQLITDTPTATVTPTLSSITNQTVQSSSSTSDSSSVVVTSATVSSTNSTSSDTIGDSASASVSSERSSASTTQIASSTPVPTPDSTPSATEASVQEEASSSSGLHSTAAIGGLIAAVCVALGPVVGVAVVVHKKRKLLEESKNMDNRVSAVSYASIRTPRAEVPVMHSAV
ncbi:Lytic transglycosylase [Phytophthora infestans]|uniref:Lytic transglycosylase n=1 Tax=Phytophthora infestans TaxID=4787 RepID=A0A833WCX2_PHYIN|nr:Lytic transglycosylase [Phytophthora infestans]KAF4035287.1 Lytic transglycosylase [Phytophthora infestans]KAF4132855.1 Lytic transglycosylase [Phytophthora infestans]KAI9982579.1 hypothetical protein PInf_008551 [Phytophthora infestans]KAI9982720.1 hypothetical protein PInf_008710 [Phytophthora infestans]